MFDRTPAEISVNVIASNVVAVSVSVSFSCDVCIASYVVAVSVSMSFSCDVCIASYVVAVCVSMSFSCDVYIVLISGLADTCLIPATMY
jgi:hypothetical protein